MSSEASESVCLSLRCALRRGSSPALRGGSIASFMCAVIIALLASSTPAMADPPSDGALFGAGAFGGETSGSADAHPFDEPRTWISRSNDGLTSVSRARRA